MAQARLQQKLAKSQWEKLLKQIGAVFEENDGAMLNTLLHVRLNKQIGDRFFVIYHYESFARLKAAADEMLRDTSKQEALYDMLQKGKLYRGNLINPVSIPDNFPDAPTQILAAAINLKKEDTRKCILFMLTAAGSNGCCARTLYYTDQDLQPILDTLHQEQKSVPVSHQPVLDKFVSTEETKKWDKAQRLMESCFGYLGKPEDIGTALHAWCENKCAKRAADGCYFVLAGFSRFHDFYQSIGYVQQGGGDSSIAKFLNEQAGECLVAPRSSVNASGLLKLPPHVFNTFTRWRDDEKQHKSILLVVCAGQIEHVDRGVMATVYTTVQQDAKNVPENKQSRAQQMLQDFEEYAPALFAYFNDKKDAKAATAAQRKVVSKPPRKSDTELLEDLAELMQLHLHYGPLKSALGREVRNCWFQVRFQDSKQFRSKLKRLQKHADLNPFLFTDDLQNLVGGTMRTIRTKQQIAQDHLENGPPRLTEFHRGEYKEDVVMIEFQVPGADQSLFYTLQCDSVQRHVVMPELPHEVREVWSKLTREYRADLSYSWDDGPKTLFQMYLHVRRICRTCMKLVSSKKFFRCPECKCATWCSRECAQGSYEKHYRDSNLCIDEGIAAYHACWHSDEC